ncbi:MAG TPA: hydantoinase/oxoprolinase family protein, partial [Allocoleopsis sp.]
EYERSFETEIAGVRLRTPIMSIHTVAAGGGSIIKYDGLRYQVGPESAGANPGPSCYRKGGNLTITDCNLILGKIQPDYFPKVFGRAGNLPLDRAIAQEKFKELVTIIGNKTPEEIAAGFIQIAVENMANAIKKISLQKGYDITEYTLCCFGGAGGQHACLLAESLGMKQIFIHPYAGVLSAYGIGLADIRIIKQKSIESELKPELLTFLKQVITDLENEVTSIPPSPLNKGGDIPFPLTKGSQGGYSSYKLNLKYIGTDSTLTVNFTEDVEKMRREFEEQHLKRYGFIQENKPLIVELIIVEIIQTMDTPEEQIKTRINEQEPTPINTVQIYTDNQWYNSPVFERDKLQPGDSIIGPALIIDPTGSNVIEKGWKAELTNLNH